MQGAMNTSALAVGRFELPSGCISSICTFSEHVPERTWNQISNGALWKMSTFAEEEIRKSGNIASE
jgi:hypothetical protein